jgi:hypothetical protein
MFWTGAGWIWLRAQLEKRHDPPGWRFIDREAYPPAVFLEKIGLLIFIFAGVFAIADWVSGQVVRLLRRHAYARKCPRTPVSNSWR